MLIWFIKIKICWVNFKNYVYQNQNLCYNFKKWSCYFSWLNLNVDMSTCLNLLTCFKNQSYQLGLSKLKFIDMFLKINVVNLVYQNQNLKTTFLKINVVNFVYQT